jgi:hypothetical protein
MAFVGQVDIEEEIDKYNRAIQATQQASNDLKANIPEVFKGLGLGSVIVLGLIYWFLIK